MKCSPMHLLKPQFRLVTFDVTNTILKFRNSVGNQYCNAAKLFGVNADPVKVSAAFRTQFKVVRKQYPNFGQQAGLSSQEWWKNLIHLSFLNAQCKLTDIQLNALSEHLYQLYSTEACWMVSSGVEKLLSALQEHNVIVGAISNHDERLGAILESMGLRKYFQFILASYVVCHEKPNKDIFNIALAKVSDASVKASEAVHIGDNYYLDYLAAKEAGWNALLYVPQDSSKRTKYSNLPYRDNDMVSNFDDIFNIVLKSV